MHNVLGCRPVVLLTCLLFLLLLHLTAVEGKGGRGGGGRGYSGGRSSSHSSSRSFGGRSHSSYRSSYRSGYRHSSRHRGSSSWGWFSSSPRMTETSVTKEVFVSMFSPRPSFIVFHSRPVHLVQSTGSSPQGQQNESVWEIQDPAAPFKVERVSYFWGTQFLPNATMNSTDPVSDLLEEKKKKDCTTYEYSNNGTLNYTVCNVDTMEQCARPLSHLTDVRYKNLRFPDGTAPTHLAWMCKSSFSCCEWECCKDESDNYVGLFIFLFLCLAFYYCCHGEVHAFCKGCKNFLCKSIRRCRSSWKNRRHGATPRAPNTYSPSAAWPLPPHEPAVTRPLLSPSAPPLHNAPPAYDDV